MQEIETTDAPASIGPVSQGTVGGDRVSVSDRGPIDPGTDETGDVVRATVFLTDTRDYDAVNEVDTEYATAPSPARSAIEVRDLPVDNDVEIEAVATTDP